MPERLDVWIDEAEASAEDVLAHYEPDTPEHTAALHLRTACAVLRSYRQYEQSVAAYTANIDAILGETSARG